MSTDLVHQKEKVLKGGDNNYWLVEIIERSGRRVVVEAEDVIEFFRMDFALATTFKSIWRLCKLKQGLGKPGSSMLYEAQKVSYYSDRSLAATYRNKGFLVGRIFRSFFNLLLGENIFKSITNQVTISQPKRLDPYTFHLQDLIAALHPSKLERDILFYTLRVAQIRHHPLRAVNNEMHNAKCLVNCASHLKQRETIIASRNKAP